MNPASSKSPARTRILVVDDHPLFRNGLAQLINHQPDLICCGEADSLARAQAEVSKTQPAVVVLDLQLRREDGMQLLQWLKAQPVPRAVLVLSNYDESLYAERALRAGARGYLMKEEATDQVLDALRTVLKGELFVSRKMAVLLLRRMIQSPPRAYASGVESLSDRELQVFQMLGHGLGTREIAKMLNLSFKTIETHRESIKHKLGLSNAAALHRHAIQWVQDSAPSSAGSGPKSSPPQPPRS